MKKREDFQEMENYAKVPGLHQSARVGTSGRGWAQGWSLPRAAQGLDGGKLKHLETWC